MAATRRSALASQEAAKTMVGFPAVAGYLPIRRGHGGHRARGPHAPPAAPTATVRVLPRREARIMDDVAPYLTPEGVSPRVAALTLCDPALLAAFHAAEVGPIPQELVELRFAEATQQNVVFRRDVRPGESLEEWVRRKVREKMVNLAGWALCEDVLVRLRDGRLIASGKLYGDPFATRCNFPLDVWQHGGITDWAGGSATINGGKVVALLIQPAPPQTDQAQIDGDRPCVAITRDRQPRGSKPGEHPANGSERRAPLISEAVARLNADPKLSLRAALIAVAGPRKDQDPDSVIRPFREQMMREDPVQYAAFKNRRGS
ncbi:hypothetical protein ACQW02_09080 [Humitalea sp. 24SJ18S-53]|uniref:hypothetical protein n=1 Tax=Humitalea sp. 24SJ18S-53 TaxID=3422307 RepID=UPI003D669DA9